MSIPIDVADVELDAAQVFLLYSIFAGDAVKTSHAAGVRPEAVLRIAQAEGWDAKLAPIIQLAKSQTPGSLERAINRAVNFSQCHRMRMFLDRVIQRVTNMNANELESYILTSKLDKNGVETAKVLSTRAIADLASAMEKIQAATYMALGDLASDRTKRKEQGTDSDSDCALLHTKIAAAMSAVRSSSTPTAQLFGAQLTLAASIVQEAARGAKEAPASPLDNDDH